MNFEIINVLYQKTIFVVNLLVQTTMDSFKMLTNQMDRLGEVLTLPRDEHNIGYLGINNQIHHEHNPYVILRGQNVYYNK